MPYFELGMDKKLIVPYADYLKAMKPDFKYIGDTKEIVDLVRCLYLPNANSVKLVGPRGSGATALMDALAYHQHADFMPDDFMIRPLFKFNGNNLFSTSDTNVIETRFHSAMEELQTYFRQRKVKPIMVIDDGCTFANNAPQHVINGLIEASVRADYVDLIVGVDKKKEDDFNSAHPEFTNSFTTKVMKELTDEQILEILSHNAEKHAEKGVLWNEELLMHTLEITQRFKSMYDTAQPNRAIRLYDSAATAFMIEIHSRAPGSYEKEQQLRELELQINSGKIVEDDEMETLQAQSETIQIELHEANAEWKKHREEIKSLQDDIRKFDVMIATAAREIQKLDDETKQQWFLEIKDELNKIDEGGAEFKGRAKADVLKLDRDSLLKFMEFDINVHRNTRIKDLDNKINEYTEAVDVKQDKLRNMGDKMHQETMMPTSVIDDIATEETKTPVAGVSGRLRDNLRNGIALMEESVFGQTHVIEPMVNSLKRAAAGLNDADRPLGVFMVAGPPGTGKTWTAEQVAVKLFGSKDYYVELNMNDYGSAHNVSSLFGAPPGYAGHGKKGRLIEIGQEKPFCVLCLDEIEKAHYDVRQALLTVMSAGRAVGLDGEEADFRNIIIIATSNFGNDKGIWNDNAYDDGVRQFNKLLRDAGDVFSPEYLDRHDAITCAGPLDEKALFKIVSREIKTLESKAKRKNPDFSLTVPDVSTEQFVKDHCLGYSGRRAEMTINQMVGNQLIDLMLSGSETAGNLTAQYDIGKKLFDFDFQGQKISVKAQPKQAFDKLKP